MSEKRSHLDGEILLGAHIPRGLKKEFDQLVKRMGWKSKRAISAAVRAFILASGTSPKAEDSAAARQYAEIGELYPELLKVNPVSQTTANSLPSGARQQIGEALVKAVVPKAKGRRSPPRSGGRSHAEK